MVNNKCNPAFQSQFAYLDNQTININDYLTNRESYQGKKISCNKGHELIAVDSNIRKKHFRHKNTSDIGGNPMTEWHAEWQGNFTNVEICFPRIFPGQVSERRADVVLNANKVIELQHSSISPDEVFSRKNDYSLHGKDIIWIIDGNNGVEVKELNDSNRCFLYFSDTWKYRSFDLYDYIYIDIREKIYKVFTKHVKSDMTDVDQPKLKAEFINALNKDLNLWDDTVPPQCQIYVSQQGAGNGKTYGIIQCINKSEFSHYKTFIYVTKQHSAKYIMFKELEEQINGVKDKSTQFDEYHTKNTTPDGSKQYIYEFTHKESGEKKRIIFATIDSFMYSIGKEDTNTYDNFMGILNNIITDSNGENLKMEKTSIKFAKKKQNINKETIFIVDETQDLAVDYARAIVKIMRSTYMDCLVVGDILQSIHYEQNAFRFFLSNENDDEIAPFILRKKLTPINVCRRFNRTELVDFVNKVVDFDKYKLPSVSTANESDIIDQSVYFLKGKYDENNDDTSIYNSEDTDTDEKIHDAKMKDIETLMNAFENEVYENNRQPNNFLFVTPFTSHNILAQELELRIHLFWEKHYENNESDTMNFKRYAIFHKSEEGTSINLEESKDATRIVSCHSAKGDGREVVFLFGFTEKAINAFSKRTDSLIFDSMINVALTRMKEKLYILYVPNGDFLHKKYYSYCCSIENKVMDVIPILPNINKNIQLNKLIDYFDGKENWEFFYPIIQESKIAISDSENSEKKIIDMGHHIIRSYLMNMRFMISIILKERKLIDRRKQHLRIFEDIAKSKIKLCNNYTSYSKSIGTLKKSKPDETKVLPLLEIKGKTLKGSHYSDILQKYMLNMIDYTKNLILGKTCLIPCPLESLVLYYMIEIMRNGFYADISIFFLYDIINKYDHGFKNNEVHKDCKCNQFFIDHIKDTNSLNLFHVEHYNSLRSVEENLNELYNNNPNIAWLNNHPISYNGGNKDFRLSQEIKYHGYDDNKKEILLCYLQPQYNSLNDKDIKMKIIMHTWLLLNYEKTDISIQNYYGKKIRACIISLDRSTPIYVDIENVVKRYESHINQLVFDRCSILLGQTNNAIYYFYNYYRNLMRVKNISTNTFCRNINKKIKEESKINFINAFFNAYLLIENDVIDTQIKEGILAKYDIKGCFINDLQHKIDTDIAQYLQFELEIEEINE